MTAAIDLRLHRVASPRGWGRLDLHLPRVGDVASPESIQAPSAIMVPVTDAADGHAIPFAALFRCASCGEVAATVVLLHSGAPDPRLTDESADSPPGMSTAFTDFDRLSIVGGPASYTLGTGMDVARVKRALAAADPRLLYEIDEEFTPFWCPRCDASYCGEHYVHWTVYDEGFFDCIRGRCPRGHERMLVD